MKTPPPFILCPHCHSHVARTHLLQIDGSKCPRCGYKIVLELVKKASA